MHIIAIWNTEGRNCFNSCNRNWLKELTKDIPEANNWDINYIHNDPYPSALSTEMTHGLSKVRKLPSDHLIKPHKDPKIQIATLDPPQSSDKVQDCRDWTYAQSG
jgi:hypothetical protein